jgi:hypothetical protein
MATTTQRKKKSIWLWVLIIVAVAAVGTAALLHFLGIINLGFLGVGFLAMQVWSAETVVNGILLDVGLVTLGVLIYYVLKTYFIGNTVSGAVQAGQQGYAPAPVYPSQTQKDTETVIT